MRILDHDKQIFIRIGGDEFVIIFKEAKEVSDTHKFFVRLNQILEQDALNYYEEQIHLTYCVGIAVFPENGNTADELISAADEEMYDQKAADKRR